MALTDQEISFLIDQKIREHERRIGFISGILGLPFVIAIVYCSFTLLLASHQWALPFSLSHCFLKKSGKSLML